ncbi:hypothetical protein LLE49_07465 [Alicyclobacillus tolerans]|uniref:hypothetical protein n=1 Tax=Alicyclobacillus tolerans TaxID=90970 RepID=UPI001F2A7F2F|nr:hypothetical protein [Alicyclobacillus tolerans]MCF8564582.1 hypothetical protein [Alicyclobacillus tolerans]
MRKQLVVGVVSSVISLGILGTGLTSVGFADNSNAKHIAHPATPPHTVPPQLQGKPAQRNPDPGIVSS